MPIVSLEVRAGDPTVQVSGQHRGTVKATFDDGRIAERHLRAPDANAWATLISNVSADIEGQQQEQDADSAVSPDSGIAASGEASQVQTCIAYIRQALATEKAYDAYLLLDRINTFVLANGDWATARPVLIAAGLEEKVYDQASASYTYLSNAGRPVTMADAKSIQSAWEDQ